VAAPARGALAPAQARDAHRRAAGLAADPSVRAVHLFRAWSSGCMRAALAGARARAREGAPAEAARLYQIACAARRAPLADVRAALLVERSGDSLALAGDPAAARLAYARSLARDGDPGRIWQKVAKARWREGRFEQVLAALARAREGGGDALAIAI